MSDTNDAILCERQGPVGVLTINRPKTLNALNTPTLLALEAKLTELERDDSVRVIVITGAGDKAFVAGARRCRRHDHSAAQRCHLHRAGHQGQTAL